MKALTSLSLASMANIQCSHEKQPNILFIMVDDFGYECLSCNGSTSYRTLNLDRLASQGMRFTQCHSTPLCTPTRVQLMTGKYNFRNYTEFGSLKPGETTFAHLFQQAGYRTCVAGKWQLSGEIEGASYKGKGTQPEKAGFDEHCLWQVNFRGSRFWEPSIQQNGELIKAIPGKFGPELFVNYLSDFIQRQAKAQQKFMVYFPMVLTHDPFVPTPDSENAKELVAQNARGPEFFDDFVHYTDQLVQRLINLLYRLDIERETLVIFTGDNGTHRRIVSQFKGESYPGGKGLPLSSGTHVPLLIRQPGTIPAGKVHDTMIDFTDFLPTLTDAARIPLPEDHVWDGKSFWAQCLGDMAHHRKWSYCYYAPRWGRFDPAEWVQSARYKLYADGRFYDLESDFYEQNPIVPPPEEESAFEAFTDLKNALAQMQAKRNTTNDLQRAR
jgi:arylsulfatase A-like enzyme